MTRRPPPQGTVLPADTSIAKKFGRVSPEVVARLEAAATAAVAEAALELRDVVPGLVARMRGALDTQPTDWEHVRKGAHELRGLAMLEEHRLAGRIADRLYAYLSADALIARPAVAKVFVDAAAVACAGPVSAAEEARLLADLDAVMVKELSQAAGGG